MSTAPATTAERDGASLEGPAPETALHEFAAALRNGRLAAAAACLTRDACLLTPDRTAVHGRQEIARVLTQLIARHTQMEIQLLVLRTAGDVALGEVTWTIYSDGPEGSRFAQSASPSLVLRKVEGAWKIAIIAPWDSR